MADELKHKDVGGSLSKAEWEATDAHVCNNEAQGDILYRDGTSWKRLAAGDDGQYLKTQGAAANPAWDTVAAGGGSGSTVNCQATDIPTDSRVTFCRFTVPAGKVFKAKEAGIYPSATADHIVEVYNHSDTNSDYNTISGWIYGDPLVTVSGGKDIAMRINNTSGSEQEGACAFVTFVIEDV